MIVIYPFTDDGNISYGCPENTKWFVIGLKTSIVLLFDSNYIQPGQKG
jgi:hypothetical protein